MIVGSRKKLWIVISAVGIIFIILAAMYLVLGIRPSINSTSLDVIDLPSGFEIEIYADDLGSSLLSYPGPNAAPRMMMLKDDVLFVSLTRQGRILALSDTNGDKRVDETAVFIDYLNNPHGLDFHDTDFDKNVYIRNPCMEPFEMPGLVDLQAHSAPLGLAFYYGSSFPEEYRGDLFVAYHGSWNRNVPTGYKIVRIDMDDLSIHDFATGWLQDGGVLGRPVDIIVAGDGSLLVSDDNAGKIYRIYYEG